MAGIMRVHVFDIRHAEQHREPDGADAQLEQGVDPQGVPPGRDEARQQQAAQAHASHERPQAARPRKRRSSRSPVARAGARRPRRSRPHSRCRRTARADGQKPARRGRASRWGQVVWGHRAGISRKRNDVNPGWPVNSAGGEWPKRCVLLRPERDGLMPETVRLQPGRTHLPPPGRSIGSGRPEKDTLYCAEEVAAGPIRQGPDLRMRTVQERRCKNSLVFLFG